MGENWMNQNIKVEMHGIKVEGTIEQIIELKKLLDAQLTPVQVKFIPHWTVQPYIYQQPYYDKSTPNPYWDINKITCSDTAGSTVVAMQGAVAYNGNPRTNGIM